MKRIVPLAGLMLGLLAPSSPAGASGDYGCEPKWKLASDSFSTCGNRAALSPGNDTRVNMFFLLQGQQGAPSSGLSYPSSEERALGRNYFYWGLLRRAYDPDYQGQASGNEFYGSRCYSLMLGARDFGAAMEGNRRLPSVERAKLGQARSLLVDRCNGKPVSAWPSGIASAPGREFLAYLVAADAFYGEDWGAAREGFGKLRTARDRWVAETAAYMLARVDLNAAQAGSFDEYGDFAGPEKTDGTALTRARTGFQDYLKRYPKGRYAASAQGLMRRTLWLAGDVTGLAREYERLLGALPAGGPQTGDLIEEIDNKLLLASGGRSAIDGPLLLATVDLMLMRDAEATGTPAITAAALAAQEPRFAGRPDLFSFVTANHAYYVGKDMRRVLQLIPDDARRQSYSPLAFSRQVLRGMALAALKDRNEAGFWLELLNGANALYQRPLVELALAMNYERSGRLADVFAEGSPIGETAIREILLQHVAGPDLLRAQVANAARPQHERTLALFTLLYRQLTQGHYAAFLTDSALLSADAATEGGFWDLRGQDRIPVGLFAKGVWMDGYACPALAASVATLARDPADTKARLCLGEFYRLNGFDYLDFEEAKPEADELGGSASLFPGAPTYRSKLYADIIADPRAPASDKAYALYRAINCYGPSGNNGCGGQDVPQSQRKAWFERLKGQYPNSEWARKLRYYW